MKHSLIILLAFASALFIDPNTALACQKKADKTCCSSKKTKKTTNKSNKSTKKSCCSSEKSCCKNKDKDNEDGDCGGECGDSSCGCAVPFSVVSVLNSDQVLSKMTLSLITEKQNFPSLTYYFPEVYRAIWTPPNLS